MQLNKYQYPILMKKAAFAAFFVFKWLIKILPIDAAD
jgi:hypothetical protein